MQYLKGSYLFFIGTILIACTYLIPSYFVLSKEKTVQTFQQNIYEVENQLKEELKQYTTVKIFPLTDYFKEDFFETKKVVYLPLKHK